ncbi:DoxX family protein [Flavobacteriaceae bacterium 14752]|uniref:DoxX family protein n=1 Tax=Mesohalobacter salilacus TaxID=2491711 RepID=UPI000F62E4DB|nr:hypothetical protein EIG84_08680 [Flavobacteriaceae bacterium 14752]
MLDTITILAQIAVAISVAFVWILRMHNVKKEFEQFGLSLKVRSFVGFAKTVISTLLVVGIWYPELVFYAAVGMAFFMAAAQYFHWSAGNPMKQKLPSLILLVLSVFIALSSAEII